MGCYREEGGASEEKEGTGKHEGRTSEEKGGTGRRTYGQTLSTHFQKLVFSNQMLLFIDLWMVANQTSNK